jgi:hypothetical protein
MCAQDEGSSGKNSRPLGEGRSLPRSEARLCSRDGCLYFRFCVFSKLLAAFTIVGIDTLVDHGNLFSSSYLLRD